MSLLERLLRLDQRVLPRLARGLRRLRAVPRLARDLRQLRELPRPPALIVVAALLVLTVVVTIAWEADRPAGDPAWSGDSVRVGPEDGASIPGYLQASREELDRLAGNAATSSQPVYALVTLAIYASPDRVAGLFGSRTSLTTWLAYARVPLLRRQTQRVRLAAERLPADLIAAMTLMAGTKSEEAARATRLAQSESSADRRRLYESLADLANAEARAYRESCACVFAVVVRGTPAALAGLATHPDVRGVDPAPEVTGLGQVVFAAPLPEQLDRVEPPIDDDALSPRAVAAPSGR